MTVETASLHDTASLRKARGAFFTTDADATALGRLTPIEFETIMTAPASQAA